MGRLMLTAIVIMLHSHCVHAQDYVTYQRIFNRIDNDVAEGNLPKALKRLDSIASNYPFVYARHCLKALQIAGSNNDSVRANYWLRKCGLQGVPLWIVRTNELTRVALQYQNCQHTLWAYDSLRSIHKANVNQPLAARVDSLMQRDFRLTKKVNDGFILFRHTIYGLRWVHNNNKQFRQLWNIMDQYGYPGERLIGLSPLLEDSAAQASNIIKNGLAEVQEFRAYFMLLHYYSNARKISLADQLTMDVQTGLLPAYQYGRINDFMFNNSKHRLGISYGVQGLPNNESTDSINARRAAIGLNSYEEQVHNSKEAMERRGKHVPNKTIVLE